MKNNWVYIALIIGLIMTAIFFWESPPQLLSPHKNSSSNNLIPYSIIDNAHTRHFDHNGQLSYQFFTHTLRHFRLDLSKISDGDYTTLDTPKLTLYSDSGPWYITADLGKATANGNILTLWKNVRIWRDGGSENDAERAIELTTDKLIIQPLTKTVTTSSQVNITSTQGHLEAIGMRLNLTTQHIKLHKQVRGHHEPI